MGTGPCVLEWRFVDDVVASPGNLGEWLGEVGLGLFYRVHSLAEVALGVLPEAGRTSGALAEEFAELRNHRHPALRD
jgi:hypothetical protein